jgi:homocitrate synthase NifV
MKGDGIMIQLIDNTLTAIEHSMPSKEDLHTFCDLLFTIGVDAIELPVKVYERMEVLPDNRKFILNISIMDEMVKYPGFYRYVCHQGNIVDNLINEIQMNDVREIVKLRTLQDYRELRIVGLDDLMCHPYEKIMSDILCSLPKTRIIFSPENNYGCASALALQWIMDYGKDITTSFAGCRNNAATEELIMAMRLAIRHKPNRDLTVLPQLTGLYEKFMAKPVGNKKPIIGKNIFRVEAGIHADGIHKNPTTYEAYEPRCVGAKSELIIGKHSGTKAVKLKMEELNLPIPEESIICKILISVRGICTECRKSLSEDEFVRLVMEVATDERDETYR